MKKVRFIIVAALLLVQTATYAVGLDFGAEFGISGSNYKIKGDRSAIDNEIGYTAGISAKIGLVILDVGPELWYTRNLASISDTKYFGETGNLKSNSIDVPVVVALSILGPLKLEVGPSFSLYNNAKVDYGGNTYDLGRIKPDVGYVAGLKLNLLGLVTMSVRYNGYLSKTAVDFMGTSYDMSSGSYSVTLGAKF